MTAPCPFCEIAYASSHTFTHTRIHTSTYKRVRESNDLGFVIRDGFPVTNGKGGRQFRGGLER